MNLIKIDKPKLGEYLLAYFVSFVILGNLISLFKGEYFWTSNGNYWEPYYAYNNNIGIKTISLLVLIINTVIFLMVLYWRFGKAKKLPLKIILIACFFGILLAWGELWFGSTFDYGTVRDKQALPFGINNAGLLGSYIFSLYSISRIEIRDRKEHPIKVNAEVAILIILIHYFIYRIVYEPWNLWQS